MNYFVTNNLESRKIVCSIEQIGGQVIWSGHKMAIDKKILPLVLQYYYDKFNSRFLFVDYHKLIIKHPESEIQGDMFDCLFNEADHTRGLEKSYESLTRALSQKFGKFKKINFIKI